MLVPYVYGAGAVSIAKQWKATGIQPINKWSKRQREEAVRRNLRALLREVPVIGRFKRDVRQLVSDLRDSENVTLTTLHPPHLRDQNL